MGYVRSLPRKFSLCSNAWNYCYVNNLVMTVIHSNTSLSVSQCFDKQILYLKKIYGL